MDDLISRETMKDAIESTTWYHQNRNKVMVKGASDEETAWYKAEDVYKAIENVPTAQSDIARDIATILENEQDMRVIAQNAQPERKTGKWIRIGGSEKCSVCGYTIDDEYYLGNFCQNCGAKMEEPE